MTGFMKTVSIFSNPMTPIDVHFTTRKGLKSDGNEKKKKKIEKSTKREIRERREKKD